MYLHPALGYMIITFERHFPTLCKSEKGDKLRWLCIIRLQSKQNKNIDKRFYYE